MKRLSLLLALALAAVPFSAGAQTDSLTPTKGAVSVSVVRAQAAAAKALRDQGFSMKLPDIVRVMVTPRGCTKRACVQLIQSHNARVDSGALYVASQIGSGAGAVANYIAVSANTTAVAKTDTTCPSEITTGGLGRAVATYGGYVAPTVLGGTATYTLSLSFSATATYTINKLCLFNAVTGGTMLFETLLGSAVSGGTGDTINVVWTVNE
jgi:hypothetical protein